ncbi:MAG: hypothetical protein KQJ78_02285 [Deltaproteobacteria bacterium]|nr:hypothetical protein [Deltaproteobacteria bacterium]
MSQEKAKKTSFAAALPGTIPDGADWSDWLAPLALGWAAGLGQTVLLRELLVLNGGNEFGLGLGLAAWLFLSGLGSLVAARRRLAQGPAVWPLALLGPAALASLLLARLGPGLAGWEAGRTAPLVTAAGLSLLVLAPFALTAGAAFPRLLAGRPAREGAPGARLSCFYGWEAAGHTLAAGLFAVLLAGWLSPAALLALAALPGAGLAARSRSGMGGWLAPALVLGCLALLVWPGPLEKWSRGEQWPGRRITGLVESPYAQLMAAEREGQTDLFANGMYEFSLPDPERVARGARLPLLARPGAREILFLGGGASGLAAEAARLAPAARVTSVDLDPWLGDLARTVNAAAPPPNLNLLTGDGRVYLDRADRRWDLVVAAQPPPVTVALNRYYSLEGFAAMARRLNPGGVALVSLPGAEGLAGRLEALRLGAVLAAAREAFGQVVLLNGPELRVFLARRPEDLPAAPAVWQARLAAAGWPPSPAMRQGVLAYELNPWRIAQLRAGLAASGSPDPNRDLRPLALWWDPGYWGGRLGGSSAAAVALAGLSPAWLLLAVALWTALAWVWGRRSGAGRVARGGVFSAGLISTGLAVSLLLAWQVVTGAVYLGLASLSAAFMAGLAAASLGAARLRRVGPAAPAWAGVALGLCPLGLAGVLAHLPELGSGASGLLLALAVAGGAATGAYFALAGRWALAEACPGPDELRRVGGGLYGLDLWGGLLGGLLAVELMPTLGLPVGLYLLAGLALPPLAGWLSWRGAGRS